MSKALCEPARGVKIQPLVKWRSGPARPAREPCFLNRSFLAAPQNAQFARQAATTGFIAPLFFRRGGVCVCPL